MDELAELRRRVKYLGIPIAADESVRKAADPLAVARAGAADLLVIKAQPLGGVHRALEIVAEAGLPAVVSSALDTSVGLAMGAALAAALPDLTTTADSAPPRFSRQTSSRPVARAARRLAADRPGHAGRRRCSTSTPHPTIVANGGTPVSRGATPCSLRR